MTKQNKMRVGSLFSGIGGLELGLELAGVGEPVWFVEIDPYAQAVLKKHWSEAKIYGDIKTVDFTKLERVDILTGGPPCTDISIAGKRAGVKSDTRSGLWREYFRAISELRPRYVVVENVAASTQPFLDEHGRIIEQAAIATFLGDLATVGYNAFWSCIPASAVGAPHRRDRILIIAYPDSERRDDGSDTFGERPVLPNTEREVAEDNEEWRRWERWSRSLSNIGRDVSYTNSERLEGHRKSEWHEQGQSESCFDNDSRGGGRSVEHGVDGVVDGLPDRLDECSRLRPLQETWWEEEHGIPRVVKQQEHRINRIRCLGNAVVPFWAQIAGEIIKEKERLRSL